MNANEEREGSGRIHTFIVITLWLAVFTPAAVATFWRRLRTPGKTWHLFYRRLWGLQVQFGLEIVKKNLCPSFTGDWTRKVQTVTKHDATSATRNCCETLKGIIKVLSHQWQNSAYKVYFLSKTFYSKGMKFLQVNYENFECDLKQGFLYLWKRGHVREKPDVWQPYSRRLKFLQVIYESFDCDLTGIFDSWFE